MVNRPRVNGRRRFARLVTSGLHLGNLNAWREKIMISGNVSAQNTRRWPRHPIDIQVRVLGAGGSPETMVPGRGTEMKRRRHALVCRDLVASRRYAGARV